VTAPSQPRFNGSCSSTMDMLVIEWRDKVVSVNMTLEFTNSSSNFSLSTVVMTYTILDDSKYTRV